MKMYEHGVFYVDDASVQVRMGDHSASFPLGLPKNHHKAHYEAFEYIRARCNTYEYLPAATKHTCGFCGQVFSTLVELKDHEVYDCVVCGLTELK